MKLTAGALLVLAAGIYALARTVGNGAGAWGYVQAGAEASMVGGLADWFAVTALFRHPLRIPIPHTAIIPRKKDQIGDALAGFVQEHFITPEIVGERMAAAEVPRRVGEWLGEPDHARRFAEEVSRGVSGLAAVLRDDELRASTAAFAERRLRELDVAPLLARLIDAICDAGQHQAALTTLLRGARKFLDNNRAEFRGRLGQESPEWVPEWLDDRVFNKGFSLLQSLLGDVIDDENHMLRYGFDLQLRDLAQRLRTDPEQIAKVERARDELLEDPRVHEYLNNLWDSMKRLLLDRAADENSELRRSVQSLTVRVSEVLRYDLSVAAKVNDALERLVDHVVTHYAAELTDIISTTIQRWDTAETSRRVELQVGRDLQFIRINGTVVGALAGLAIYGFTQLF
ncbi:MAG TPA: DUF445 domain-containing protein [Jatrophihabitans sp.]|jgi:uncharacterized membrane-anchored protein YjiN (DUF445 family)|nr:DUF445 domain-containing protein [Jatrophihabitans sp.]